MAEALCMCPMSWHFLGGDAPLAYCLNETVIFFYEEAMFLYFWGQSILMMGNALFPDFSRSHTLSGFHLLYSMNP